MNNDSIIFISVALLILILLLFKFLVYLKSEFEPLNVLLNIF